MPSPLYCRLDQVPSSADQFICGVAPSITARFFSSGPSDSTSRWTPCPPENCEAWLQVHLGCIRLSSLCPFRLLHTFRFLRPATYYRRFWIQRSSSERRRDLNPPDQCAAQRKVLACGTQNPTFPLPAPSPVDRSPTRDSSGNRQATRASAARPGGLGSQAGHHP